MDLNHINDMKKFIKQETPINRLTSLKLPRDLTLGGAAVPRAKKQFAPNVNIHRNKNKAKEILKKNEPRQKAQKVANNIQDRRKDRFVQSSGIFSAGFNSDIKRTSTRFSSDRRNDKENDGANTLTMPTIKTKNWEVDSKNENNVFEDLLGCDEDYIDEKLPFQPIQWSNPKLENNGDGIKSEIKTEDDICDDNSMQPAFKKLKIKGPVSEYWDSDIYDDNTPAISVWNMPDSMCGKGLSDDPNCTEVFDYCLSDMQEGKIGKLVMRKSGKLEVHIGRVKYSLDTPDLDFYKEHIVALDVNAENKDTSHKADENKGTATVLGEVKNRYSLNPDWSSLLF